MRHALIRLLMLAGMFVLRTGLAAPPPTPAPLPEPVPVVGPTVIAFAPLVSAAELERLTDNAVALDDFTHYLASFRSCLAASGVALHEVHGSQLRTRQVTGIVPFNTGTVGAFGYYLIAPGRRAKVLRGVHSPADLATAASAYFSIPLSAFGPCATAK
jgi:hypothetical protein